MGKLGRAVFLISFVALIAFFIVMLILSAESDENIEAYRVSVIINDSNDYCWKNFRKGIDNASVDYNADVNFVMLPKGADTTIQEDYIEREILNEADAIVVSAINGQTLAGWLQQIPASVPVIIVREDVPSNKVNVSIKSDNFEMGKKLADNIKAASGKAECTVFVAENSGACMIQRLAGLEEGLKKNDIDYSIIYIKDDSWDEAKFEKGVLIALDEPFLEHLIESSPKESKLYGIGFTNEILHALDDGKVLGLVVQSDYTAGYLCIKSAVNELKHISQQGSITLDYYSVNNKNMYEKPLDQILFPLS